MLPLKLLRSLLLGQSLADPLLLHHPNSDPPPLPPPPLPRSSSKPNSSKKPTTTTTILVFNPTNEAVADTYGLASLARDIGLDLNPTSTLSHIIFSAPSSAQNLSSFSTSSFCLPNDAVPLPFPALYSASLLHLRAFVSLTQPLFKLVKLRNCPERLDLGSGSEILSNNWERCGLGLYCRRSGVRVEAMDGFCGAMAGAGWSVFKTRKSSGGGLSGVVMFLFRKVEVNKFGIGREREVRLPFLDFQNAPLRILQYVVLMTDDVFFLA